MDRGRTGSKNHVIVEAHGIPLAVTLTGGNRDDVTQLIPLLQAVPPIRGKRGRPHRRPDLVHADFGLRHHLLAAIAPRALHRRPRRSCTAAD